MKEKMKANEEEPVERLASRIKERIRYRVVRSIIDALGKHLSAGRDIQRGVCEECGRGREKSERRKS